MTYDCPHRFDNDFSAQMNLVEWVNVINDDKWNPLHHAVFGSHLSCVKLLVDLQADVNALSISKKTPLFRAVDMFADTDDEDSKL